MKFKHVLKDVCVILSVMLLPSLASAKLEIPEGMQHYHAPKNLPDIVLTPRLKISISEDDISGYNLHLATQYFQLESPNQQGSAPDNIVEGHGRLYINGTKIQRIYGNDVHIPGKYIHKGVNQISVTLNGHDHRAWRKDGKEIISTIFINTEKNEPIYDQFSTFPVMATNP